MFGSKPVGIVVGIILFLVLLCIEILPFLGAGAGGGGAPNHGAVMGQLFANLPPWVQVWMKIQDIIIASSLWFILARKEAQIYALAIIANHVFLFPVMPLVPLDKLTLGFAALSHFLWIPSFIYLITRWPKTDKNTVFGVWLTVAIGQMAFSLSFDIPDGLQFLLSLF